MFSLGDWMLAQVLEGLHVDERMTPKQRLFLFMAKCAEDTKTSVHVPFAAMEAYARWSRRFPPACLQGQDGDGFCSCAAFAAFMIAYKFKHLSFLDREAEHEGIEKGIKSVPVEMQCACSKDIKACQHQSHLVQFDVLEACGDLQCLCPSSPFCLMRQELEGSMGSGKQVYEAICRAYARAVGAPPGVVAVNPEIRGLIAHLTLDEGEGPPESWFWVSSEFRLAT